MLRTSSTISRKGAKTRNKERKGFVRLTLVIQGFKLHFHLRLLRMSLLPLFLFFAPLREKKLGEA